jgi:hypothetical protein
VKYWQQPVPVEGVDRFMGKVEAASPPKGMVLQRWFFSRSSFEAAAVVRLWELGIHHSNSKGFNRPVALVGASSLPRVSFGGGDVRGSHV